LDDPTQFNGAFNAETAVSLNPFRAERIQTDSPRPPGSTSGAAKRLTTRTSGYDTCFTTGGAIRIAHYDVIDDVITRKL